LVVFVVFTAAAVVVVMMMIVHVAAAFKPTYAVCMFSLATTHCPSTGPDAVAPTNVRLFVEGVVVMTIEVSESFLSLHIGQLDGQPDSGPAENPLSHAPYKHDVTQRHVVGQKNWFVPWQYAGVSRGSVTVTVTVVSHPL
jgi:hypothetical protein